MSDKYSISPFVNFRCLDGTVVAVGDEDLVEFEGAEALLLAAFAVPRTCDEAASFLNNHGFDCSGESLSDDVELLQRTGILQPFVSDGDREELQMLGGSSLYSLHVLQRSLGHDGSFLVRGTSPRDGEGQFVPLLPYPVVHWLRGYDLSGRRALLTMTGAFGWWSESFASVNVVKSEDLSAVELSSYSKGNVDVVDAFPEAGGFDLVELSPSESHSEAQARSALKCVSDGGVILLRCPEWSPEALKVLRESDMIEINLAGFQPHSGAPRGCSIFVSAKFDWAYKSAEAAPVPLGGLAKPDNVAAPPRVSLAPSVRNSLRPSLRAPGKS